MLKYKHGDDVLVLSHYYTEAATQELADFVGDSLELSKIAAKETPKRIVFASVRFMAEQAKLLSPTSEVILPHKESTCSLVKMTNIKKLKAWKDAHPNYELVSYINCSVEQKAISDIIVTSANVVDIVQQLKYQGKQILFANDRNMGDYLNWQFNLGMIVWQDAVCEVHDKFKEEEIDREFKKWTDGEKYLIAHPESPLPVLKRANVVGSTSKMLKWIENFKGSIGTIFVATEEGLLHNMRQIRPDLDIRQAPIYDGCQCNRCEYMKMNTPDLVQSAIDGITGIKIDYISDTLAAMARKPIERMLEFSK